MIRFIKNVANASKIVAAARVSQLRKGFIDDIRAYARGKSCSNYGSEVNAESAYRYYNACSALANAINIIITASKSVWPIVTNSDKVNKDHPILDLLDKPGFNQNYESLLSDYLLSFLLTGNAYINVIGNINSKPSALQFIDPSRVAVKENNQDGYAESYSVSVGGSIIEYNRVIKDGKWRYINGNNRELIHQKGITDSSGIRGLSPLNAVKFALDQRLAGDNYNLSFLQNGISPSAAITSEQPLSEQQFQSLKEQLHDRSGSENAGKWMLLEGGKFNFIEFSKTPRDLGYGELIKSTEAEIYKAMGIPAPMIDSGTMSYNNYQTAQYVFWYNTVCPLLASFFSHLTNSLMYRYGTEDMFLYYDESSIKALQLPNFEQAKRMQEVGAFTDNEIRKTVGYENYEGGDVIYKPATLLQVGEDALDDELPLIDKDYKDIVDKALNGRSNTKRT